MRRWAFLVVLAALAAGPATQPSTRPTTQTTDADLRRIISLMQKEIADLKTENAKLHRDLWAAQQQIPAPPAPPPEKTSPVVGTAREFTGHEGTGINSGIAETPSERQKRIEDNRRETEIQEQQQNR